MKADQIEVKPKKKNPSWSAQLEVKKFSRSTKKMVISRLYFLSWSFFFQNEEWLKLTWRIDFHIFISNFFEREARALNAPLLNLLSHSHSL